MHQAMAGVRNFWTLAGTTSLTMKSGLQTEAAWSRDYCFCSQVAWLNTPTAVGFGDG